MIPNRTVLIVEDDPFFKFCGLDRVLSGAGYRCSTATTAASAIEQLSAGVPPSAVVIDVRLPDGERAGIGVGRVCQERGINFLYVTAVSNDEVRTHHAQQMQPIAILQKPVAATEVCARIDKMLAVSDSTPTPDAQDAATKATTRPNFLADDISPPRKRLRWEQCLKDLEMLLWRARVIPTVDVLESVFPYSRDTITKAIKNSRILSKKIRSGDISHGPPPETRLSDEVLASTAARHAPSGGVIEVDGGLRHLREAVLNHPVVQKMGRLTPQFVDVAYGCDKEVLRDVLEVLDRKKIEDRDA